MKPTLTTALLLAALLPAARAGAQGFAPALPQPAVSPYINLLRRGSDPAINYYGLVRPIVDQQGYNQQFLDREGRLQTELDQERQASPLEEAARVAHFQTAGQAMQLQSHHRYFQTLATGGGSAGPPGQSLANSNAAGRPATRGPAPR